MNHKLSWLLGFRSNKIWKMLVSVAYMVFCVVVGYNFLIATKNFSDVFTSVIFILAMVSPYIVLSNTPLREKLPFFNMHKTGMSFIGFGMLLVLLAVIMSIIPA